MGLFWTINRYDDNTLHASGSNRGAGLVLYEAQRSLDTGDTFGRNIIDNSDALTSPTRIIGPWGDTPQISHHVDNLEWSSIRFINSGGMDDAMSFQRLMEAVAERTSDLQFGPC